MSAINSYQKKNTRFSKTPQDGNVAIRILIVVLTLLVIGAAIFSVLNRFQEKQQVYHRKAMAISDYGLMMALQNLHINPSWRDGFKKTDHDNGWFKVEIRQESLGKNELMIISEGHYHSVIDVKKWVLQLVIEGSDSSWIRAGVK
jgi:hypothetical protein